jgi:metal-dependent amidase/aminoacylase/carboxypeptidase family protein
MLASAQVKLRHMVESIAAASGATADFTVDPLLHYDVTYNDPALTARMLPTLRRVAGDAHVVEAVPLTGGEDFSAYQHEIPGLFVLIGVRTPGAPPESFPPNHSPRFHIDESALGFGVRTMTHLAVDYLNGK